jgi:hypothetical protein
MNIKRIIQMIDWEIYSPILALILGNAAFIIPLFLWNRSESRNDMRLILGMISAIQTEMKDFHGRLCMIEERNKK